LLPRTRNNGMRVLLLYAVSSLFSTFSSAAEPKPDIVSLLTLVIEQNRVDNPNGVLSGNIANVTLEDFRIEHSPHGEGKELLMRSKFTSYDTDVRTRPWLRCERIVMTLRGKIGFGTVARGGN
jgi:hypothetical protein